MQKGVTIVDIQFTKIIKGQYLILDSFISLL